MARASLPLKGSSSSRISDENNDVDFDDCDELLQMALSAQFVIKSSGESLQPHLIVYYLRDIAQNFHQFYK